MTCYIGEGIFRTSNCSAVIVSNGHPNEEKTIFPALTNFSLYILRTTDCESAIGGENLCLDHWNGSQWINDGCWSSNYGYGYSYMYWASMRYDYEGQFRITWGDCTKQFTTKIPPEILPTLNTDKTTVYVGDPIKFYGHGDELIDSNTLLAWLHIRSNDLPQCYDACPSPYNICYGKISTNDIFSCCYGTYTPEDGFCKLYYLPNYGGTYDKSTGNYEIYLSFIYPGIYKAIMKTNSLTMISNETTFEVIQLPCPTNIQSNLVISD